ncbi:MAG: hypothetical protein IH905_09750 [Proteobacteria bacterium]|nr:hypothetical protein [Pseudomonadota bacterium]
MRQPGEGVMLIRRFLIEMLLPGTLLIALYAALVLGVLVHGAVVEF